MMSNTLGLRRPGRMVSIVVAAGIAFAMLAAIPGAQAYHSNLLPNSGFQQSALEPHPQLQGKVYQPVLPTGWAFEGVAGLFDHTAYYCLPANLCGGNYGYQSDRSIAISIPAGGKKRICANETTCGNNPVQQQKDDAGTYYKINPHWRNVTPVAVSAGQTYGFSVWTYLNQVTVGEGVVTAVRWYNANGQPIGQSNGPERRVQFVQQIELPWGQISGTFTAPAGATGAVVLLGHSDDIWTGHVRFDNVFFGPTA